MDAVGTSVTDDSALATFWVYCRVMYWPMLSSGNTMVACKQYKVSNQQQQLLGKALLCGVPIAQPSWQQQSTHHVLRGAGASIQVFALLDQQTHSHTPAPLSRHAT
jgi:hypothetical protein